MSDELKRQAHAVCAAIEQRINGIEQGLTNRIEALEEYVKIHASIHKASDCYQWRELREDELIDTPNPLAVAGAERVFTADEIQELADPSKAMLSDGLVIPPGFFRVKTPEEIAEMMAKVTEERRETPAPRKPREWWTHAFDPAPDGFCGALWDHAHDGDIRVREVLPGEEALADLLSDRKHLRDEIAGMADAIKRLKQDACDSQASLRGMLGRAQQEVERLTADLVAECATVADVVAERDRLREELADHADVLVEARKSRDDYRHRWERCSKELAKAYSDNTKIHAAVCIANSDYAGLSEDLAVTRDQMAGLRSDLATLTAERDDYKTHYEATLAVTRAREQEMVKLTVERDVLREFVVACYECATPQYAKRKGYRDGRSRMAKDVLAAADAARENDNV